MTCRWCHRSLLTRAEERVGACIVCRPMVVSRAAIALQAEPVEGPAGDPEHGGSRQDDHRAPTVPAPPPDPPTERMDE